MAIALLSLGLDFPCLGYRKGDNEDSIIINEFEVTKQSAIQELTQQLKNNYQLLLQIIDDIYQQGQLTQEFDKLLLVADQFEELYTLEDNKQEAQKFLDCILNTVENAPNFKFVLTLRADFYGYALSYLPFGEVLQNACLDLLPMAENELQQVIVTPAQMYDVDFEEGLTERILEKIEGKNIKEQRDNLPLLEFTLTQLWRKQGRGGILTNQVYDELGGIEQALANHAEEIYSQINTEERKQLQQIFVQLISPGEGTDDTRRIANRKEIKEKNWQLVLYLNQENVRLVVVGYDEASKQETVEVVHEILIRGWGRLNQWMQKDREFRLWQEGLRGVVNKWENKDKDEGFLFRGKALVEAEDWLQERSEEISDFEQDFIRLSIGLREREEKKKKQRQQRIIWGLTSGLFAVTVFAVGAVWQWQRAEYQRLVSETDNLGNLALNQFNSGEGQINALMIALEGGQKLKQLIKNDELLANYPTTSPLLALQTITSNIREKNDFKTDTIAINKVIFTPDGKKLISYSKNDGKVIIWNLFGQKISEWDDPQGKKIVDLDISPNGKYIATINAAFDLYIFDLSGKKIAKIERSFRSMFWTTVKFSPDSKFILLTSNGSSTVEILTSSGKQIGFINRSEKGKGTTGTIHSLTFTPSGNELIIGDAVGTVEIWNLKNGQKIREFKANKHQIIQIKVSSDGQRILTLGLDVDSSQKPFLVARLWDLSGKKIADFNFSLVSGYNSGDVSFSPDGQQIATVIPGEGIVKFYDVKTGKLINQTIISQLSGYSLSYSPDGQTIAVSGIGIKLLNIGKLNMSGLTELPINYEVKYRGIKTPSITNLQYSADSQKIVITDQDNNLLDIWNWQQKEKRRIDLSKHFLKYNNGTTFPTPNFAIMTPDGKSIIIVKNDEGIKKIDLEGNLISQMKTNINHGEMVLELNDLLGQYRGDKTYSSSFDGSKIATVGYSNNHPNSLRLWDLSTQQVKLLRNDYLPQGIAQVLVSPDGKYIFTVSRGRSRIWDISGNLIAGLEGDVNNKSKGKGIKVSSIAIVLDSAERRYFYQSNKELSHFTGIEILEVFQNSTAKKAGLKSGNIIIEIDGHKISDIKENIYHLLQGKAGSKVKLKVITSPNRIEGISGSTVKLKVITSPNKIEEKTIIRENFIYDETDFIYFLSLSPGSVKFTPNSQYLVTWGGATGELHIRNIKTNKVINWDNQSQQIVNVYFSPDSKLIAVTSTDYSLRIYDFSGKLITQIKLQKSANELVFKPDSQEIAVLSYPNELSIWSITGKPIAKYTIPEKTQGIVEFSPDGKYIATAGSKVMIWKNQNLDELLATGCNWLKDYLAIHPEEKQKLKVCQENNNSQ